MFHFWDSEQNRWHCLFQAVISSKDYQAAQKHCESENGSLLEIKSQEENDFISHFLLKHFTSSELWTGGLVTILAGKPINIWPSSQVSWNLNFEFWKDFWSKLQFYRNPLYSTNLNPQTFQERPLVWLWNKIQKNSTITFGRLKPLPQNYTLFVKQTMMATLVANKHLVTMFVLKSASINPIKSPLFATFELQV